MPDDDVQTRVVNARSYYETYWSDEGFNPAPSLGASLSAVFERYIPTGARCLDVGCGDGATSGPWLSRHGRQYIGLDVSETAVREARRRGLEAHVIDDASQLPYPDDSFDAVVCVEVLEHLFEPHLAVREALRVLTPGGVLVATVPNIAYWRSRVDLAFGRWNPLGDDLSVEQPWRDPHIRFFTADALRRMLVRSGFEEVTVGGHDGAFLGDLPIVRRRRSRPQAGVAYSALARRYPSLFCLRLHAAARKATA